MSTDHLLSALRQRRFLLSAWPWRSVAYSLTTFPVLAIISTGLAVLALPWIVAIRQVAHGDAPTPVVLFLVFVSAAMIVTFGPLLAIPLGALERQRLAMVDLRPVASGHRPVTGSWLRVRYAEAATWRELAYLLILAAAGPLAYGAVAALVFVDLLFIGSPLLAGLSDEPVMLWSTEAATAWEALPFALGGLVLVPLIGYVIGLLAAAHAAIARALLGDAGGTVLTEVTRSRARLVDAFEAERQRIERDLHDGAQHRLTSLTLQLAVARLDLADGSPASVALDKAHGQAKELMVVLRELIHGIRPQILTEMGLGAAVRELAAQPAIPVTVTDRLSGRLPERLESTAYFAVSEALANVTKHSKATSASVSLAVISGRLIVEVSDNGQGGANPVHGTGLTGLADRVAAASGRLLLSSPPGGPTLVRVELPCGQ